MESISEKNLIKSLYFLLYWENKTTTLYGRAPKASAISYGTAMHYLDGAFPIENGLAKWAIPPRLGPPYLPMAKQLFRYIAVQTSPNRRRNLIAGPCADRPAGLSSKKDWLCPRKWLMLFSLKFQGNNQKNASTMDSAKGKTGEKDCLFNLLWR